ncbi:threonine aldolase family protein [Planctomycetes bacterium K23_9]|uniref:L-allo-threonine aldolase n=1 Tax=Stieleria marina TaxID=1930275 RepID=A0A517NNY5_9BACT|nr:L-allo-threonine aldolase [Planctomycetes bacterium K23_9]
MPSEIDLRSDTVTQPTDPMRQAMASAHVGDAVIDVDPTLDRLEKRSAEILGKAAAIFVPSGSMANQIAVRVHCGMGNGFICEGNSHVYHYEQGAFAALSGLIAQTVFGDGGVLTVDDLRSQIHPEDDHSVRTKLLCIENTHNRWGGRIQPQKEVVAACDWAHGQGVQCHLDGARLWNASVASGATEKELCDPFDSVGVCFSKGLGAPVGSVLAGSESFISEARRCRKLFGGAMRQAGIIAAGALYALENHRERLADDHTHAKQLGDAIEACGSLSLRDGRIDTNMIVFDVDAGFCTAADFQAKLESQGVRCFAIGDQAVRLVTHLDVNTQQIETACGMIQAVAK